MVTFSGSRKGTSWQSFGEDQGKLSEIIENITFVCARFNSTFLFPSAYGPQRLLLFELTDPELKANLLNQISRLLTSSVADMSTTKLELFLLMHEPWEV